MISFSPPTSKSFSRPKGSLTNPAVVLLAVLLKKLKIQDGADIRAENVKCILRSAIPAALIPLCRLNPAVINPSIVGTAIKQEDLTKVFLTKKGSLFMMIKSLFLLAVFPPPFPTLTLVIFRSTICSALNIRGKGNLTLKRSF
jgi:hypothetical protein